MLQFQKSGDPVALPVALVNTWDELARPAELLLDLESLRRFLEQLGVGVPARLSRTDLEAVREVRDLLRGAFEAPDEPAAVDELNELLRETRAVPRLERAGRAWSFAYVPRPRTLAGELAASAAMALLEAIRTDGWARFGLCDAEPCRCVFVDRSKNRSRRYCSQLCADRVAQAAYRRRRSRPRAGVAGRA